jgi:hypothetical protein
MKEPLQMVLWTHLGVAPTTTPPVNRLWELKSLHGVPSASLSTVLLLCLADLEALEWCRVPPRDAQLVCIASKMQ